VELIIKKKYFAQFLLCITTLSALLPAFAAPISDVSKKTTTRFERIAKKLNLSSEDLATILFASPAIFLSSFLLDILGKPTPPGFKTLMLIWAIVPPILAIGTPKKAIDALARTPGLKQFFQGLRYLLEARLKEYGLSYCENKECKGLCTECKAVPLYTLISLGLMPITAYFGHQYRISEQHKREQEAFERLREYFRQREHNYENNEWQNAAAPNIPNHDLYHALGVAQNATQREIAQAYRRLARQFHPDKAMINNISLEEANRRMQQTNEANQILSNPETRREYDQMIRINRGNH
jgi:hypothetical protein